MAVSAACRCRRRRPETRAGSAAKPSIFAGPGKEPAASSPCRDESIRTADRDSRYGKISRGVLAPGYTSVTIRYNRHLCVNSSAVIRPASYISLEACRYEPPSAPIPLALMFVLPLVAGCHADSAAASRKRNRAADGCYRSPKPEAKPATPTPDLANPKVTSAQPAAFTPPFPDRLEIFEPPKRAQNYGQARR